MVGHDHEISQLIAFPIKETERVFHDSLGLGFSKWTGAVALIEPYLKSFRKTFMVFAQIGNAQRFGMGSKPLDAFILPLLK